ncbi:DNA repair protein RadA [Streptococcus pneumoniae]|nr:DNA repair protein RadA [Streptococcus pneumoniae]
MDEPAIDLAVAVAIASSYKDKPLGFTKIYVPQNSLTGITLPKEIQVIGVTTIQEVLKKVFA